MTGSDAAAPRRFHSEQIAWGPCAAYATTDDDRSVHASPDGQCGRLEVPPDHTGRLSQRFDLVGFDPRDVAKDLDILRAVLGDAKLTYLGYSHDTRIGSTCAEDFPQNLRAVVLDGAVDPTPTAVPHAPNVAGPPADVGGVHHR